MLNISPLSFEEVQTLEEMHKNHSYHRPRIRAHAILLSRRGFSVSDIASIHGICRQTVATWLHDWEEKGICGLFDEPRSGRPRKQKFRFSIL